MCPLKTLFLGIKTASRPFAQLHPALTDVQLRTMEPKLHASSKKLADGIRKADDVQRLVAEANMGVERLKQLVSLLPASIFGDGHVHKPGRHAGDNIE